MWKAISLAIMLFVLSGCWASLEPEHQTRKTESDLHDNESRDQSPESEQDFENQDQDAETPAQETEAEDTAAHRHYDFEDIPIPQEMNIDRDASILFESQGIKAGMLTYTGRVNSASLFNFFQHALPNKNWEPLSYIKYGTQIQTFSKDDRLCIIRIIDGRLRTELQIWISPKI